MVLHKSLGINFCEYFLERYHTKRWHGFPIRKGKRIPLRIIKYKRTLHRSLTSEESLRIAKSWRIFLKSRQKSLRMSSYGIDISKLWYWYFQIKLIFSNCGIDIFKADSKIDTIDEKDNQVMVETHQVGKLWIAGNLKLIEKLLIFQK